MERWQARAELLRSREFQRHQRNAEKLILRCAEKYPTREGWPNSAGWMAYMINEGWLTDLRALRLMYSLPDTRTELQFDPH